MSFAVLTVTCQEVSLLCTNEIAIAVDLALGDAQATVCTWAVMVRYVSFNVE